MILRKLRDRLTEPRYFYEGLRNSLNARIESGELTPDMELSSVLDSLDTVQLTMETEELGIESTVPIKTVGDLFWLLKAIDFKRHRKKTSQPQ
jgi:acyl carrier protein